jgi:hypothetical protein
MAEIRPFDRQGNWDLDALEKLKVSDWDQWLDARLHGRDRLAPYDPDEHPADLFIELIERHAERVRTWQELATAAAEILKRMDPLGEAERALLGAVEIIAHLHSLLPAEEVCDWIQREVFLFDRRLPRLHRALLYALACMQERGKPLARPLLERYLRPLAGEEGEWRYAFMVPAFAGVALGSKELPRDELVAFLRHVVEADKACCRRLNIAPAALTLFVERDRPDTQWALWQALSTERDGMVLWERLRQALDHTRHALPERPREPRRDNGLWAVAMIPVELVSATR